MTRRTSRWMTLGLVALMVVSLAAPITSQGSKDQLTGIFWQCDPNAGFEGDGSNFCAPTSVANGLIYLARARGMKDLVDGTDHDSHAALIKSLAEHMETDPEIGTPPSRIINGLQDYVQSRGYHLSHLEIAGWRKIDSDHQQYLVSSKPSMSFLREAADDPDTVLIFNNGWYRHDSDGGYVRKGGHFVVAVGAGPGSGEFHVHNSALEPDEQKSNTSVTLSAIGESTVADASSNGVEELDLQGYFSMKGPGLPFTAEKAAIAALDFVIAFQVKK